MATKKSKAKQPIAKPAPAKAKPKKKAAPKSASKPKKPVKVKAKKPKAKDDGGRLFNCKLLPAERGTMKKHAKAFAGGNLSAWVRFAACHFKPNPAHKKLLAEGGW